MDMPLSRCPDKVTVQLRSNMGDVVMTVDFIWVHFQLSMQKGGWGGRKEKHKGKLQNQHKQAESERKSTQESKFTLKCSKHDSTGQLDPQLRH